LPIPSVCGSWPRYQAAVTGLRRAGLALAFCIATLPAGASPESPSSCSSEGQRPPNGLVDRFISADCADCWTRQPALRAGPRAVALDWIVPGTQQEDAPPFGGCKPRRFAAPSGAEPVGAQHLVVRRAGSASGRRVDLARRTRSGAGRVHRRIDRVAHVGPNSATGQSLAGAR
jgi:hypothetical protein